ncbi:hypothetical protein [Teredinibacter turnerae]|uniref:hypothetical protein n=1 Tax=Teredinibacter turnerae TaxID=2426 RepID=UPI0003610468|nr:hypothetical protein [Teredinibacter turnerae]
MSISVSAFYPDAHLKESAFANALTRVAMALAKENSNISQRSAPQIEVVFMLSGKFDSPGFEGMRIRRYDSKEATLVVESAVPEKAVNATNAQAYVVAAILDAVENAGEFLKEIEMSFNEEAHMQMVQELYPEATTS